MCERFDKLVDYVIEECLMINDIIYFIKRIATEDEIRIMKIEIEKRERGFK